MFKLIYETNGYEGSDFTQSPKRIEMTLNTEDANLEELLEFYGDFLKACTFEFDGKVQIGPDNEYYPYPETADDFAAVSDELDDDGNLVDKQTEFNFEGETQAPVAGSNDPAPEKTEATNQ